MITGARKALDRALNMQIAGARAALAALATNRQGIPEPRRAELAREFRALLEQAQRHAQAAPKP